MLSRFLNLWLSVSLCVFYTGCFYWSCPISMSVSKLCHPSGACRICLHIKPGIGIAPSDCALKVFSPVYYESVAMNTRTLRHCVVGGTHLSKVYQYINIVERFSEHGHGKWTISLFIERSPHRRIATFRHKVARSAPKPKRPVKGLSFPARVQTFILHVYLSDLLFRNQHGTSPIVNIWLEGSSDKRSPPNSPLHQDRISSENKAFGFVLSLLWEQWQSQDEWSTKAITGICTWRKYKWWLMVCPQYPLQGHGMESPAPGVKP